MVDSQRERSVSVTIDPASETDWTLNTGIFGKFNEHLGSAIYPGVFEDYVHNGSFEVWNTVEEGPHEGVAVPETPAHDGVAYPWEPIDTAGAVSFTQAVGGEHGRRRDDDLDYGTEVPDHRGPNPAGITDPRFQRIELAGEGGVAQRVALPDFRTDGFDVSISVRGAGVDDCTISLTDLEGKTLAATTVSVTDGWERHEVRLTLDTESPERYRDSRYGEYRLTFTAGGNGHLDLDWAMLMPEDVVEGKFNPTTIEYLRENDVTTVRWPGGNYASQYRWRDGIGPIEDRPVVPIVNWGGLEPNYLGTNEWLRFCELADVEPYLTVPFWSATGPEEAAAWVEYVNGSTDTEMGALRAEHGHPEPYDVTYWGIGNEVWGDFQVGHTDAVSYAETYPAYHDAMRAVDPDIRLDASAMDPWLTTVHDGSEENPQVGERPVWNDLLFEGAPGDLEGIDVHRYTWGILADGEDRETWLDEHDEDPVGYNEILVNFPAAWTREFDALRERAAEHGYPDLRITAGEWALSPGVEDDWPAATVDTMAGAAYAARSFQTFVHHGGAIRLAHWTDYSLYAHPDPERNGPPHPGAHVQQALADPLLETDADWHRVDTAVTDSPTRPHPAMGVSTLDTADVELVDAVTLGANTTEGRQLQTWLVNGSLRESADAVLSYPVETAQLDVTRFAGPDGDPFVSHTWDQDGFERESFSVKLSGGTATIVLPPAGVAIVAVTL
ncbi:MAG: hypothetical protein ABEI98_06775 [Halorhabdus sp.]